MTNSTALVGFSHSSDNVVLLGTALVNLSIPNGKSIVARAVLHRTAQKSFISESCSINLAISCTSSQRKKILRISSACMTIKGLCHINISSLNGHIVAESHPVVVLDNITTNLPDCRISSEVKERTHNLVLADPTFDVPSSVDLLIGSDLFPDILRG